MRQCIAHLLLILAFSPADGYAGEPIVLNLWPGPPPGDTRKLDPEADLTKLEDKLIAGRRIIKLGNVAVPQIAVYSPPADQANGAAVIICPGGGHHILAWDLEGTEVAEWLNSLGVTGIVLKYRVPAADSKRRWYEAVQDAQRAMSLVRSRANEWNLDPERIGICGFSAGGETAALTALFTERQYEPLDTADEQPTRPNFALLIYAAGMVNKENTALHEYIHVTKEAPPMFFVHAWDDRVSVQNPLLLASALKQVDVPAELHLFATGGHGYGLRPTSEAVTRWSDRAGEWLAERGYLSPKR